MPHNILKIGQYFKVKKTTTPSSLHDLGLDFLPLEYQNCFKIIEFLKHYTMKDIRFVFGTKNYIIPANLVEPASEDDVRKMGWFAKRPLDISQHPRTRLFK